MFVGCPLVVGVGPGCPAAAGFGAVVVHGAVEPRWSCGIFVVVGVDPDVPLLPALARWLSTEDFQELLNTDSAAAKLSSVRLTTKGCAAPLPPASSRSSLLISNGVTER